MQDSLEVPNNLTIEEAQQAINTASRLKAGTNAVTEGISKISDGAASILSGGKRTFRSALDILSGK